MTPFMHDASLAEAVSGTSPFSVSSHPEDMAAAWMRASVLIVGTAVKVMASDMVGANP